MGRPKVSQTKVRSKARKHEHRIKFGNYHLDLVKHPENFNAVHLSLDSNNIFGYCTGYLSMPHDPWTHFVNGVIPKVKVGRYYVVNIYRSGIFLVT